MSVWCAHALAMSDPKLFQDPSPFALFSSMYFFYKKELFFAVAQFPRTKNILPVEIAIFLTYGFALQNPAKNELFSRMV